MKLIYNPWPAGGQHRFFVFGDINNIFKKSGQFSDVRARLGEIQKSTEKWTEEWLEKRETEGWIFPDGDLWGIPPADED